MRCPVFTGLSQTGQPHQPAALPKECLLLLAAPIPASAASLSAAFRLPRDHRSAPSAALPPDYSIWRGSTTLERAEKSRARIRASLAAARGVFPRLRIRARFYRRRKSSFQRTIRIRVRLQPYRKRLITTSGFSPGPTNSPPQTTVHGQPISSGWKHHA